MMPRPLDCLKAQSLQARLQDALPLTLLEDRYERKSVIITSQLASDKIPGIQQAVAYIRHFVILSEILVLFPIFCHFTRCFVPFRPVFCSFSPISRPIYPTSGLFSRPFIWNRPFIFPGFQISISILTPKSLFLNFLLTLRPLPSENSNLKPHFFLFPFFLPLTPAPSNLPPEN